MPKTLRRRATAALIATLLVMGLPAVAAADDYCRTRHPIVLAHGMSGFDDIFGVIEYWHRIPAELRGCGARVYITTVPQFSTTALRGESLLGQIEEIVAIDGSGKVNLIGHSHGGLDARYVASVRPDLVASVTTVGSPNKGAELADFLRANIREGSFTEGAVSFFANSLGSILSLLTGTRHAQDSVGALEDLSTAGMARFNAEHPQGVPAARCGEGERVVRGIRYYSWSGTAPVTNILDVSDAMMGLAALAYDEPTDGLVGQCSSHLGDVIRSDYRMNHLDEVNLLFGLRHLFGPNPLTLFRQHGNRLKNAGL